MQNRKALIWLLVLAFAAFEPRAQSTLGDGIMALAAVEDSGGATPRDLNQEVLQFLERRTVDLFTRKAKEALRSMGKPPELPKLQVASHYLDVGDQRLAIIKISAPKTIRQVFLYGIVGNELRRVACARNAEFERDIPLSYGSCGSKITEVFRVSLLPK